MKTSETFLWRYQNLNWFKEVDTYNLKNYTRCPHACAFTYSISLHLYMYNGDIFYIMLFYVSELTWVRHTWLSLIFFTSKLISWEVWYDISLKLMTRSKSISERVGSPWMCNEKMRGGKRTAAWKLVHCHHYFLHGTDLWVKIQWHSKVKVLHLSDEMEFRIVDN